MLRRSHILTTAALLAFCVAPGYATAMVDQPSPPSPAGHAYQDLRSPDARDAALSSETQVAQDLRSPDARDAALAAETQVSQDLRSPDARDAGRVSTPAQPPLLEIREGPENGFDWGDAGIGAAGILAMVTIAAGLMLLVGARRRRRAVQTAH